MQMKVRFLPREPLWDVSKVVITVDCQSIITGSIPVHPAIFRNYYYRLDFYGSLAQLVEHRTCTTEDIGSFPICIHHYLEIINIFGRYPVRWGHRFENGWAAMLPWAQIPDLPPKIKKKTFKYKIKVTGKKVTSLS